VHVLDTSVLVAAFRSRRGASHEVLRRVVEGEPAAVLSNALMTEYEAVLTREAVLAAGWADAADVAAVLDVLAARVVEVVPHFKWRPALRDADDDMVLECAANGRASAIVTLNAADFVPMARDRFGIEVLRPGELLRRLAPPGGAPGRG
jgi:putative PIN family toxin of toxin-antitoxin system